MLYILSPLTIFLLLGIVIQVGAEYADSRGQLGGFMSQFFSNFATRIPVQQYARDKFEIKPLIWHAEQLETVMLASLHQA
ncbi:hypothetical protein X801_10752 [Opisthorchis viverrini]|uniref:Uncharacterized protein n=1 Tax=Opisthorchis viverrini TaxID=6198 RepID=A0A1S8WGA2_OPIVI|nr:hypothetical protein X801_10752 [Opisthorchis viverrini]